MSPIEITIQISIIKVILWILSGLIPPICIKGIELYKTIQGTKYLTRDRIFDITLAELFTLFISALAGPIAILFIITASLHDVIYEMDFIIIRKTFKSRAEKGN